MVIRVGVMSDLHIEHGRSRAPRHGAAQDRNDTLLQELRLASDRIRPPYRMGACDGQATPSQGISATSSRKSSVRSESSENLSMTLHAIDRKAPPLSLSK